MKVRPATKEDIEAFSSTPNKPTIKAFAGEVDGEVVALGGLALSNGRWVGFCDLRDEARPFRMTIARAAIRVFREAREQGIKYIYAEADEREPTAHRWLTSLGFVRTERGLYRWSG